MSDAPQAAEPQPSRVARLLSLVRKLIDYGRELADTLRRNPGPLSAGDIAAILARITRGLQRAEALEARIVSNADRLNAKRRPTHAARRRTTRPTPSETNLPAPAASDTSLLARLPTPEEIAVEVRRRPIGAVIADICRDLGIMPNHPLWPELRDLIIHHGGNLARFVSDIHRLLRFWRPVLDLVAPLPPPPPMLLGTGPPV